MRRTASQVIRSLEMRVARLERSSNLHSAAYSTGNVFDLKSIDRRVKTEIKKTFISMSPEVGRDQKVKLEIVKVHHGDYYHPHMMIAKATSSVTWNKDVAYFILTWDETDVPQQYIYEWYYGEQLKEAIADFDDKVSRL
jgi:hypothetical protein